MVALRCIALLNDSDINDKNVCRAYRKDGCLHVVGGIISSGWQQRNRVPRLNCAKCRQFGRDILTAGKIPG